MNDNVISLYIPKQGPTNPTIEYCLEHLNMSDLDRKFAMAKIEYLVLDQVHKAIVSTIEERHKDYMALLDQYTHTKKDPT